MLSGVSKTAILTLRARAEESTRPDRHFEDPYAVKWLALAGWPEELDRWYSPRVQSFLAFRADELDRLLLGFLAEKPGATVVELGAGLSSRYPRFGAQRIAGRWIDLDLPEVIELRRSLGIGGENHRHLARSVLDFTWMDEIPADAPIYLTAEGLLYYLPRTEVDRFFRELRRRFPGAVIAFDILGDLDFRQTLERSTAVSTPVLWKIDPPFARVFTEFGLEELPGLDHDSMMNQTMDRYWPRFGRVAFHAYKLLAKIPSLREKRSGVVIGRLRPL